MRKEQRLLGKALDLLDQALESSPNGKLVPHLKINKANALKLQGHYEASNDVLYDVLPLILALGEREPRLLCTQRFALADNLVHLNRPAEAEALLPELRALTAEIGNALDGLRLRWLEGRVAAGLGRRQKAIEALSFVRQQFADHKIAYDTALATLELAVLYLEQGDTAQVKALAGEMAPIFEAQGVHREALAALALFVAAAKQEKATTAWAQSLVRYLYLADGDRTLRFEPPA